MKFQASSENILPGQKGKVRIKVSGFKLVTTAQFSLRWDAALLKFEGIGEFGLPGLVAGNFNTTLAGEGKLAVSWDDQAALGLDEPDGTVMFAVEFTAVGAEGRSTAVEFGDSPTVREVTANFEAVRFEGENGVVTLGEAGPVIAAPVISEQPKSQAVGVGGDASFAVVASGREPLVYQWRFNGAAIVGATGARLELKGVRAEQAGQYSVEVSNGGGSVPSAEADLGVVGRPELSLAAEGGIRVTGTVGQKYRLEYVEELQAGSVWQALTTLTLTTGAEVYVDGEFKRTATRFYRAVWVP